ncbi:cation transporter [Streptomyces lydicus]|uniref:cation transporter n=1 Tax=Streptomyces lydicus TaxID=47763 RepID=UPI0037B3F053
MALGAHPVIALAELTGALFAGSPALLSEAAHSAADSLEALFLPASLKRSARKPDA